MILCQLFEAGIVWGLGSHSLYQYDAPFDVHAPSGDEKTPEN